MTRSMWWPTSKHGRAAFADFRDERRQRGDLFLRQAGRGFVEQQRDRPARQRARDLHEPLHAEREVGGELVGITAVPDESQQRERLVAKPAFVTADTRQPGEAGE